MMLKDQERLLSRVRFKGKGIPHRTTSLRRGALGIRIVNDVLRTPTPDSIHFALLVIRCLYVYEDSLNIPRFSLDKALVSLCDKMFSGELFEEMESRIRGHLCRVTGALDLCSSLDALAGHSDPLLDEVVVGYLVVRFREYGLFEEKSVSIVERVGEKLRSKARRVFGGLLSTDREGVLEKEVGEAMSAGWIAGKRTIEWSLTRDDLTYLRESYALASYVYDVSEDLDIPHLHLRRRFSIGYFSGIECWNGFTASDDGDTGLLRDRCFRMIQRRMYDLTAMEELAGQSGSFERAFMKGYVALVQQRFRSAKEEMKRALETLSDLGIKGVPEILLCLYDLLSLSHLFCGEYFECMFYLDRGIVLSVENQLHLVAAHFLDCKLVVERMGRIPGPSPRLRIDLDLGCCVEECMEAEKSRIVENRMYASLLLEKEANSLREIRTLEHFSTIGVSSLSEDIQRITGSFPGYSILSLYCIDGVLFANDFRSFTRIRVDFVDAKERLGEIIAESRRILKRSVVDDADKARWWMERIDLDARLRDILCRVSEGFDGFAFEEKVILVLDETTTEFPFESMPILRDRAVYRVPSLECLEPADCTASAKHAVFYLLDPENNLPRTQKIIVEFLDAVHVKNGVVGRPPSASECRDANRSSIVLYFGHGGGTRHLRLLGTNRAVLLFGCNSAKLHCVKNFKRNGSILKYLESSVVVGCLWEVTDKDIDRFSIKVVEGLASGTECLGRLVSTCRGEFKMKHLNGASIVVYGLPRPVAWRNNL